MVKMKYTKILRTSAVLAALLLATVMQPGQAHAAGCTAPATSLGSASVNVTIPSAGAYTIWSRIMAADAVNNSYSLEVDGNTCYVVGDNASIPANAWTWVNYQSATANSVIRPTLSAGNHTLKLVGSEPNVKVDRLLFLSDTGCTPADTGDNCTTNVDQIAPTVNITAPTDGATVSGTVNLEATATDNTAVTKVEFYIDGTLKTTMSSGPYNYSWNSASVANGQHTVLVKGYDAMNNVGSDSITVNAQNNDTQAPTAPTNLTATAAAANKVNLSWTASTDNIGVTGYSVTRNGSPLAQVGNVTTYSDTTALPNMQYTYQVTARDAAGNNSSASNTASVTTPTVADTQAPTKPSSLSASAASSTQINLVWGASTDNVGVAGYDVYRSTGTGTASKVATVTTTSYGDTNLSPSTSYTYHVIARDSAGNSSPASDNANATTQAAPTTRGGVHGKVTDKNGKGLANVTVAVWTNSTDKIYKTSADGTYQITGLQTRSYTIEFLAKGYRTQFTVVKAKAGQDITKNVTMQAR